MTLEEAIRHCEKKAQDNLDEAFILSKKRDDGNEGDAYYNEEISACVECAFEHKQLAEWLTELKARREVESKPEEAKTYCNHRKCKIKECKNNLANAPKGEIVPIVGFTECGQYKKFVAEADRQARKDLDQAIVDAFDDTDQFRRDAHNLD